MRIGAKVPNSGPLPEQLGIGVMGRSFEQAGFDSLWVSDHIVLPAEIHSRYPFAPDGRATWPTDTPYFDALVSLALLAEATKRATIGTAVLVLPLRHPVIFAKQAASIDVASGGRLRLGLGAGWLEEEFEALAVPFVGRGHRLEEWIAIARACWTGAPDARSCDLYDLPGGIVSLPAPAAGIPLLIGGHSRAALRRAGWIADGWLAQQSLPELDPGALVDPIARMRDAATEAGRDAASLQVVLRIVDASGRSEELARRLPELIAVGVDEVIVDVSPEGSEAPDVYGRLSEAVAGA